jgi:hypothetical protein
LASIQTGAEVEERVRDWLHQLTNWLFVVVLVLAVLRSSSFLDQFHYFTTFLFPSNNQFAIAASLLLSFRWHNSSFSLSSFFSLTTLSYSFNAGLMMASWQN